MIFERGSILFKNFWIVGFFLFSLVFYKQMVSVKDASIYENQVKLTNLENEKERLIRENDELKMRINSQDDLEWIELVLMRELGVVAKDKLKVFFVNKR